MDAFEVYKEVKSRMETDLEELQQRVNFHWQSNKTNAKRSRPKRAITSGGNDSATDSRRIADTSSSSDSESEDGGCVAEDEGDDSEPNVIESKGRSTAPKQTPPQVAGTSLFDERRLKNLNSHSTQAAFDYLTDQWNMYKDSDHLGLEKVRMRFGDSVKSSHLYVLLMFTFILKQLARKRCEYANKLGISTENIADPSLPDRGLVAPSLAARKAAERQGKQIETIPGTFS